MGQGREEEKGRQNHSSCVNWAGRLPASPLQISLPPWAGRQAPYAFPLSLYSLLSSLSPSLPLPLSLCFISLVEEEVLRKSLGRAGAHLHLGTYSLFVYARQTVPGCPACIPLYLPIPSTLLLCLETFLERQDSKQGFASPHPSPTLPLPHFRLFCLVLCAWFSLTPHTF